MLKIYHENDGNVLKKCSIFAKNGQKYKLLNESKIFEMAIFQAEAATKTMRKILQLKTTVTQHESFQVN